MIQIYFDYQIFSWQQYGGISRYFIELARQLATTNDLEFKIIAPLYVNKYLQKEESIPRSGKYISKLPYTVTATKSLNRFLSKFYFQLHSPGIVHETFYSEYPIAPKNSRTVITIHDMIHEKFPEFYVNKKHIARAKKKSVKRADHIICVSKNTQKDLLEIYDVPYEKTSVIYHGVTFNQLSITSNPKKFEKPYLLHIGDRGPHKNFSSLLKGFAQSTRLLQDFVMICFGGGPFTAKEKTIINQCNIPIEKLIQTDGNDETLAIYLKNAACFVCPSLYEGFGLTILEAMACGCPVVCSDSGSLHEIASTAAEFFDPKDISSLAQAIENTVYSSARKEELISLGKKRIKYFSWQKCFDKTLTIYRSLTN